LSAVALPRPTITPADRLGLTLCLAAIAHATIILGVSFNPEEPRPAPASTMEITLVQQTSPEAPENARVLAQANLQGGGDSAEDVMPSTPIPPPFPDPQPAVIVPPTTVPAAPVTQKSAPVTEKAPAPAESRPVLTANQPGAFEAPAQPEQEEKTRADPQPRPTATQLLTNSFKIASLSAEIKRKLEAKAQRPRLKFISASTSEYKYAAYMEAWRAKVERVGNLNYPDEARRRGLSGSLILDVALNADGSVDDIIIRRSSGERVLDDAAVRIVNLAAPFSPFPPNIRADTDILHITRTWQFINNQGFR
jgi:protein TonB